MTWGSPKNEELISLIRSTRLPSPSLCFLPPESLFFSGNGDCSRDVTDLPDDWRFSIFLVTEGAISSASGERKLRKISQALESRSSRKQRRVETERQESSSFDSPRSPRSDSTFPPPDFNLRRSSTQRSRDLRRQASVSTLAEKISFSQATGSLSSSVVAMAAPD
ncbi:hypothetical protein TIFTF001_022313 [Ficus carica]|uniref:Uncharacterized protein n=1 Tax=Ficus carica TaxID=3494 RepID=A0AA88DJZ0_FICCA|nr:hypothetical protein TIFTF001_022313 [Ficus carica]